MISCFGKKLIYEWLEFGLETRMIPYLKHIELKISRINSLGIL